MAPCPLPPSEGLVSEVDGAISGDGNAGHPDSAVGFDLESAWSFRFVPPETSVICSEDLRLSADRQAPQLFRPSWPELPWETEAARGIFGEPTGFSSELPSLFGPWAGVRPSLKDDADIQPQVEQKPDATRAVFLEAIKHRADSAVEDEQRKAWGAAVSKWVRIIM